ncbi:hypothetical protein DFH09DRAFT_1318019 [Mycena vulgaris]|nr:hypothetical protein DFH09DRAFT_1318019 [Mycena vulgaris]
MARNSSRQSKITQKTRESNAQTEERKQQIAMESEACRQSSARSKDLNEQLKAVKGTGKKGKSSGLSVALSASSCGRVKTAPMKAAYALSSDRSCPVPATGTVLVDRTPAVHTSALEFTSGDSSQPLTPWSNDMHTTANVSFDPPQLHGSNFHTIQPMSQDSINSWYNPAFYSEAFMQPLLPSESGISPAYAESLPGVAGAAASPPSS